MQSKPVMNDDNDYDDDADDDEDVNVAVDAASIAAVEKYIRV